MVGAIFKAVVLFGESRRSKVENWAWILWWLKGDLERGSRKEMRWWRSK
jgi:hypothetical protein